MTRQVLTSLLAGFAGAALFHALGAGAGQSAQGIVTAREFRMVDSEGRKRASLRVEAEPKDGVETAGLSLFDPKGAVRAALCLMGSEQGNLFLYDSQGHKRLRILDGVGRSEISMSQSGDKGYVRLSLADRGPRALLTMRDADGDCLVHTRGK